MQGELEYYYLEKQIFSEGRYQCKLGSGGGGDLLEEVVLRMGLEERE